MLWRANNKDLSGTEVMCGLNNLEVSATKKIYSSFWHYHGIWAVVSPRTIRQKVLGFRPPRWQHDYRNRNTYSEGSVF